MSKSKEAKVKNLDEVVEKAVDSNEPVTIVPVNLMGDRKTQEVLEAQEKVPVLLEKRRGEYPEMDFTVNGVRYTVRRGITSLVPKQIADMLYERQRSEGKLQEVSDQMMKKAGSALSK